MFRVADKTVRKGIRTDSWFSWYDHATHNTSWEIGPLELRREHLTPVDNEAAIFWSESTKWSFKMEFKWGD